MGKRDDFGKIFSSSQDLERVKLPVFVQAENAFKIHKNPQREAK